MRWNSWKKLKLASGRLTEWTETEWDEFLQFGFDDWIWGFPGIGHDSTRLGKSVGYDGREVNDRSAPRAIVASGSSASQILAKGKVNASDDRAMGGGIPTEPSNGDVHTARACVSTNLEGINRALRPQEFVSPGPNIYLCSIVRSCFNELTINDDTIWLPPLYPGHCFFIHQTSSPSDPLIPNTITFPKLHQILCS